ncbi:GTP-binding protein [Sporosarcina sp. CAU 1771]
MFKTIGILAHVDAGKTTFTEQLLYHTKSIRQRGRVDHKDTFLDSHSIEKDRGITVFADQATFFYNDSTYTIIDTPGHVDFSPEMERSIQVMDYAVVLINAVDGIEGHTETVWNLLEKHRVPTFFFINKTDREGADVERVIHEFHRQLTIDTIALSSSFNANKMEEKLIEFIAERDENLFERYMDTGYNDEIWLDTFKSMIRKREAFPCFSGSALQDDGILNFLSSLDMLTTTSYNSEEDFAARIYKIRHDESLNRITFLKLLSGTLKVRDEVHTNGAIEKITQMRVYNGNKFKAIETAQAGELIAVSGLSSNAIGDGIGTLEDKMLFELIPTLTSKVVFSENIHIKDILKCFTLLDAEDPSLHVIWDSYVQEIHVHVMGVIQLEVLKQIVSDRFQFEITFDEPKIIYKETVNSTVVGYGHFEPLRHYAEVHIKIEPSERNSGISFENVCHSTDLSVGNQNLVRSHLFEQNHHGLLTGSTLTDIKITLLTGRGHNEHTSGGDFREATYRALRQGLEQADNILLEPYYSYKLKIDSDHIGRALSDIQKAHGNFSSPETHADKVIIEGKVPVSTFMNYSRTLASYTNGKGVLRLQFGGYDVCHNSEEVINTFGYNKDADPEYTSTSIFCIHGKGYKVPWDQAKKSMHCI